MITLPVGQGGSGLVSYMQYCKQQCGRRAVVLFNWLT